MFFVVSCQAYHPIKIYPERITWQDKKLANDLGYDEIEFPVREKDFSKLKKRPTFALTFFVMETS